MYLLANIVKLYTWHILEKEQKYIYWGQGAAQQFKALTALPEDSGFGLSTHFDQLQLLLQLQGI